MLTSDVDTLDITNRHEVAAYMRHHAPDDIISCAAFTNVDGCETNQEGRAFASEMPWVRATQPWPRRRSAQSWCMSPRIMWFSGDTAQPDLGTRTTRAAARSTAKQSCWASSRWCSSSARTISLCVRRGCTATRATTLSRRCFGLARQNGGVTVVDDQLGNPTNAADLAHEILNLLVTKEYGVYHCTGEGRVLPGASSQPRSSAFPASRHGDALHDGAVHRRSEKQIAPRPAYSALENAMLKATIGNGNALIGKPRWPVLKTTNRRSKHMKTYLVTGGAGFIGSNFVLYMLEKYKGYHHCQMWTKLTYAGNLEEPQRASGATNAMYSCRPISATRGGHHGAVRTV